MPHNKGVLSPFYSPAQGLLSPSASATELKKTSNPSWLSKPTRDPPHSTITFFLRHWKLSHPQCGGDRWSGMTLHSSPESVPAWPRFTTLSFSHTATIKQTRAHRYTDNTLSGGHGTTRRPSVLRHDVYPSRGSCSPLITVSHGDSTVGLGDGPDRRFPSGLNANRACVAASGLIYCRANNWNLFPHVANTSTMVASITEVEISVRKHQEIPLLFPQIKSKETEQNCQKLTIDTYLS